MPPDSRYDEVFSTPYCDCQSCKSCKRFTVVSKRLVVWWMLASFHAIVRFNPSLLNKSVVLDLVEPACSCELKTTWSEVIPPAIMPAEHT